MQGLEDAAIDQASFHQVKGGPTPFFMFCNLWRHLHMFLNILELGIKNKKKELLEKTVFNMWSQIAEKLPKIVHKIT